MATNSKPEPCHVGDIRKRRHIPAEDRERLFRAWEVNKIRLIKEKRRQKQIEDMRIWAEINSMRGMQKKATNAQSRKKIVTPPPTRSGSAIAPEVDDDHHVTHHHRPKSASRKNVAKSKHLKKLAESPLVQPLSTKLKPRQRARLSKLNGEPRKMRTSMTAPALPGSQSRPSSSKGAEVARRDTVQYLQRVTQDFVEKVVEGAVVNTQASEVRGAWVPPVPEDDRRDRSEDQALRSALHSLH